MGRKAGVSAAQTRSELVAAAARVFAHKGYDGATITDQTIAVGPAASQIAIKQLGTNGGGFFNANSAHPFENPTALSNFLQMITIFVLGAGLTLTFGKAVGNIRQGWAILAAMLLVLAAFQFSAYAAEAQGNPRIAALGVDQVATNTNPGGNMEGKETRFGVARSALFAVATTATSTGYGDISPKTTGGRVLALALMHISIFGVAPMIIVRLIDRLNENRDAFTHEEQEAILARLDRIETLIAAQVAQQPRAEAPRE